MTQKLTIREVSISKNTAVDWLSFMRCICIDILEMYSEQLGGPGKVVEIDESAFGKRKYNRGARRKTYWIFGGIERNANPPKMFFIHVEDRSKFTLSGMIEKYIKPQTTIMSDCWSSYQYLEKAGFDHLTVNHTI
ncbi:unnamed protein product [Brachionus calyciflorus]|uniref:ISXO2-like transposase domain-containing protein n=1 Tax=Brachionus calyciflorus TaxID=104777 RepID=A0A814N474_9BILA|nr:unnamed protein product [Brachionus calyciflorus]